MARTHYGNRGNNTKVQKEEPCSAMPTLGWATTEWHMLRCEVSVLMAENGRGHLFVSPMSPGLFHAHCSLFTVSKMIH